MATKSSTAKKPEVAYAWKSELPLSTIHRLMARAVHTDPGVVLLLNGYTASHTPFGMPYTLQHVMDKWGRAFPGFDDGGDPEAVPVAEEYGPDIAGMLPLADVTPIISRMGCQVVGCKIVKEPSDRGKEYIVLPLSAGGWLAFLFTNGPRIHKRIVKDALILILGSFAVNAQTARGDVQDFMNSSIAHAGLAKLLRAMIRVAFHASPHAVLHITNYPPTPRRRRSRSRRRSSTTTTTSKRTKTRKTIRRRSPKR